MLILGVSFPRDESGKPGFDDLIESIARRDSFNRLHGTFRKGRDVKAFADVVRIFRGREDGGASLEPPGDTNLSSGLTYDGGNFLDDTIFEQFRLECVAQRRERKQHDLGFSAGIEQFPLRKIGMRLDLHNCGTDSCRSIDFPELVKVDIRQADCMALAFVHETFHSAPRLEQRNAIVVNRLAIFISRILILAWSKSKRGMD